MKRNFNFKEYFLGRRFGKVKHRLIGSLFVYLAWILAIVSSPRPNPLLLDFFGACMCAIPFFLFPVAIWGIGRQKRLAWLLSVVPLVFWVSIFFEWIAGI
ncbi:MAG: hypothetical protein M2R45_04188 [Verrucomicrobia subdivision 3 bacterium]|nr:hypothetical protein [Limisphaerales bacterium]MCS1413007.1 hypothetical protein [Limisphaerales bacterium]